MELYRAKPGDGCVWITGGSSGIGLSLALELSKRGYTIAVSARGFDVFDSFADHYPEHYSRIHKFPCDVTDAADMEKTCRAIADKLGPITLAVLNAGTYLPVSGIDLSIENFRKTIEVNYMGVVNGLVPVVDMMKKTGRGQIALTASVTAYNGLPTAASYGPTKAALNSMAQSLKFDFDRMNIRIQVINPGFVASELTKKNDFPMPGLIAARKAAWRLANGLEHGGFEIRFPKRVALPLKFLRLLPYPLYFWLIARMTGADKPLT